MMSRVYLQSKSWPSNIKPLASQETKVRNLTSLLVSQQKRRKEIHDVRGCNRHISMTVQIKVPQTMWFLLFAENVLTVTSSKRSNVCVPVLVHVLILSVYLCNVPAFHSHLPSLSTLTTWPSRFLRYTAPFKPYRCEQIHVRAARKQSSFPHYMQELFLVYTFIQKFGVTKYYSISRSLLWYKGQKTISLNRIDHSISHTALICLWVFVSEVEALEELCWLLLCMLCCLSHKQRKCWGHFPRIISLQFYYNEVLIQKPMAPAYSVFIVDMLS